MKPWRIKRNPAKKSNPKISINSYFIFIKVVKFIKINYNILNLNRSNSIGFEVSKYLGRALEKMKIVIFLSLNLG